MNEKCKTAEVFHGWSRSPGKGPLKKLHEFGAPRHSFTAFISPTSNESNGEERRAMDGCVLRKPGHLRVRIEATSSGPALGERVETDISFRRHITSAGLERSSGDSFTGQYLRSRQRIRMPQSHLPTWTL